MGYCDDELMHYGVKGMKWGVRRARPQTAVDSARANYKTAKKEYNKSFNKAYNRAVAAYSPVKKHRQANDKRWEDAANKAEKLKEAKADYKKAKVEQKLNKQAAKTSGKTAKYKQYEHAYKLSDAGAKDTLTPTQYARYATSGARMAQKRKIKELKRASDKSIEKTNKMIKHISDNYNLAYDVTTGVYTIKRK